MRGRFVDLVGHKFGRLSVVSRAPNYGNHTTWNCVCDCGNGLVARASNLRSGTTKSCGCWSRYIHTVHGLYSHHLKGVYDSMLRRCYEPQHKDYEIYGGRGVLVCDRWLAPNGEGLKNFINDMGERPDGTTLDRKDVDGNYEPTNCRWATRSIQAYNQRRRITNTSGKTGVSKGRCGKWVAKITKDGKRTHIGSFESFEAACAARSRFEVALFNQAVE